MKGKDMLQNMYVKKSICRLLVQSALTLSLTACVGHAANPAERKTLTMKVDDSNKIEASSAKAGCQWRNRRKLYNSDGHNAFLHCYPPESKVTLLIIVLLHPNCSDRYWPRYKIHH